MNEKKTATVRLYVTINGTDTNPWHRFGLRQNPFPQIGRAEYAAGEQKLASLDGDPVRTADDIRERLAGFNPVFVEEVIRRWQPGRRVRFKIVFPAGRNTAEPSGELAVGDVVAVGEVPLSVGRVGWNLVRGGLKEVRTDEHGTHPCPQPARHDRRRSALMSQNTDEALLRAPDSTTVLRDVKDLITADVLGRLAAGEPFDGEVLDPDPLRIEVIGRSRLRLQLRIIYDDGRLPRYFNVTEVP